MRQEIRNRRIALQSFELSRHSGRELFIFTLGEHTLILPSHKHL